MKKVLSLLAFAMIMLGISACDGASGASTPADAVKSALSAMKSGDAKAFAAVACDRSGEPMEALSDDDAEEFKAAAAMFANVDYTVGDTEYSDDGNRAEVSVTLKMMGHESDEEMTCIKGEDGKWRVRL